MKEKKGRLYKFYGKLTIRNKLLISCLPFVILGYFLIFYSTTVIMFDQMKQMVYEQTEQNVMEKKKLVNTLLDNYNQATIKFLYYTDEVQEYLNTRQSVLSVEEQEKLTDMISYQIGSLITNNQDALMNVCIYNKFNELYINNAIYYNTIEQTNDFAEILKEEAEEKHGKPVLRINPVRKNMITFARNIYVPQIEKSDEKIGFLMMDIDKTGMEKIIQTGEDRDVNAILILDSENNILVNGSNLSDDKCKTILKEPSGNYKIIRYNLQYDGCSLVGILDKNLLFKSVYKIFFKEMVMILAAISIIAIALFITAAKIAEQIQKFIVKLRQTTEINSNAYVEVDSNDEFRELANVYNTMLERIDLLIQQVYKQQLLMKDAQIESLQAQINPHFLYNTLDCINSLADMGKTTEVKKTVTSLGSIMRMSIKGAQFLKIEEELKYVNQYLYIQKMRFQEHIICLVEIPEQLYEYYIPKLMIQPLLENAIVHGVSELKETGMIAVTGKETEDAIYITVKDNGNGMPETIIRQLEEIRENGILKEKEHIGIFNIQQRLLLLYGKEYGLTVEHVKPSGTAVTICIPKTKGEKGYESGNYR